MSRRTYKNSLGYTHHELFLSDKQLMIKYLIKLFIQTKIQWYKSSVWWMIEVIYSAFPSKRKLQRRIGWSNWKKKQRGGGGGVLHESAMRHCVVFFTTIGFVRPQNPAMKLPKHWAVCKQGPHLVPVLPWIFAFLYDGMEVSKLLLLMIHMIDWDFRVFIRACILANWQPLIILLANV